jgi:putative PIN family toxin of toxin-antitoxin system
VEVLGRESFDKYLTHTERIAFLAGFVKVSEMIDISRSFKICRDPKDDKLLELAVSGCASFLITGDQDLLVLSPFRGVQILTPRQFLAANEGNK